MYQKVVLIGRLGKDPETRYTQGGEPVTTFSVATSEKWKKDGQAVERTEWHNITAFKRLAEICGEYLRKGSLVMIEGKLQTDKYEKDGVTRYSTKIIAREMKMLSSNDGSQQQTQRGAPSIDQNDFEDDIPF